VVAEGDRHIDVAGRGNGGANRESFFPETDLRPKKMRERERREQVVVRTEVELGYERRSVVIGGRLAHLPMRGAAEKAVDREAVLLQGQERGAGIERDRLSACGVLEPG